MSKKGIVFLVALLLFGVAGGAAFYLYNKPHRDIASEKPAFTISGEELYREFETDEMAANKKYLDKVIVVAGNVENISQDMETNTVVTLTGSNMGSISCTMKEKPTDALQTGDNVTLKCRCTGKLMDVVMVDCSIQK